MKIIWNKVTWYSKLLAVIVLAGVIWLGFYFHSEFKKVAEIKPVVVQNASNIDTSDWKTYKNEEYGFEFKYPVNWYLSEKEVYFREDYTASIIQISQISTTSVEIYPTFTSVQIYPNGYPADTLLPSSAGEYTTSTVNFNEGITDGTDFLLENGKVWFTYAILPNTLSDYGFLKAEQEIKNLQEQCYFEAKKTDLRYCFMGGIEDYELIVKGDIDDQVRQTIIKILESLKFTK